jgi:transcriptional regulator with XRE-family HTH domain
VPIDSIAGERGVIDMELSSVIRRWRYRQHFSIREIARRTELSRNAVRKYLRSDSVEPKFKIPLTHAALVILDELGYLPFSASGGALLFHLLASHCLNTSKPNGTARLEFIFC